MLEQIKRVIGSKIGRNTRFDPKVGPGLIYIPWDDVDSIGRAQGTRDAELLSKQLEVFLSALALDESLGLQTITQPSTAWFRSFVVDKRPAYVEAGFRPYRLRARFLDVPQTDEATCTPYTSEKEGIQKALGVVPTDIQSPGFVSASLGIIQFDRQTMGVHRQLAAILNSAVTEELRSAPLLAVQPMPQKSTAQT